MKRKGTVLLLAAALALLGGAVAVSAQSADLPGLTSKDPYPHGCVDCHNALGADRSPVVTAELAKVSGHPKVDKLVKTIPNDCVTLCHKVGGKGPLFNLAMHTVHFQKPTENRFVTVNNGNCLACHALNPATGEMSEKSGPRNW